MTKVALVPVQAPAFAVTGLPGLALQTRYLGATASGAPSSGTFVVGDWVWARNGHIWFCTVAGSPGTWVDAGSYGGGGSPATTVQTESGLDAGQVGTSTNYAREDHRHPITNLVSTVAGRTGAVALTAADIAAGTFPSGIFSLDQLVAVGTGSSTTYGQYPSSGSVGSVQLTNPNAATSTNVLKMASGVDFVSKYWTGAGVGTATVSLGSTVTSAAGATAFRVTAGDLILYNGTISWSIPRGAAFAPTHTTGAVVLSTTLSTFTTVYTAPSATYKAGRRYHLTFFGGFVKSSANGGTNAYDVQILNGATVLAVQGTGTSVANAFASATCEGDWVPGADVTVALTVKVAQTAGTVTAASSFNSSTGGYYALTAEDVGT